LLEEAAATGTSEWAVVDEDEEVIPDQGSISSTGLLNRFKTGNLPSTGPIEDQMDEDDFGWDSAPQPAAEASTNVPDWLKNLDTSEVEVVSEPELEIRPGTAPLDQIDWGVQQEAPTEALYADDEPTEAAEMPDWLSGMQPPEPEPALVEQPRAGTTPLDQIDWGDQAVQSAEDDHYDEEPVQAVEMPDWLSGMQPAEPEPVIEEARAGTTPLDQLEWGDQAEPVTAADMLTEEPVLEAETPDWLAQAEPPVEEPLSEAAVTPEAEFAAAWDELAPAEAASDEAEWAAQANEVIAEADAAIAEPVAAVEDDLGWMREAELEAAEPEMAIAAADELNWEAQPESAEAAWLEDAPIGNDDLMAAASTDGAESWAADPVPAGAGMAGDWADDGEPEAESDWEEVLETSPALNAPDWLNDMVPGLDINYDAEEDTATEELYVPVAAINPGTLRQKVDYAWLMEIADEESRNMLPITDTVLSRKRRYIFTREPVWLRRPTEQRNATAVAAESDIDLPPWLQ
jgi:hypothetical protein